MNQVESEGVQWRYADDRPQAQQDLPAGFRDDSSSKQSARLVSKGGVFVSCSTAVDSRSARAIR